MKKRDVEKEVVREILKSCSLSERIVVKSHQEICIKVYRKGLQDGFNWCNKSN